MLAEGGRKKLLAEPVIRVVLPHVDLAQDDVALANHLVGGQRGVQHGISEHIDGDASMLGRDVDVIHRAVEGRVGVEVAAVRLDGQGDFATRAPLGALEQHVFEEMGETRPEQGILVNAAGFHPNLHGSDGGRSIALKQGSEPVGQY